MFGTSEQCIATLPSDMAIAMRALDATVETVALDGSKRQQYGGHKVTSSHPIPSEDIRGDTALCAS